MFRHVDFLYVCWTPTHLNMTVRWTVIQIELNEWTPYSEVKWHNNVGVLNNQHTRIFYAELGD